MTETRTEEPHGSWISTSKWTLWIIGGGGLVIAAVFTAYAINFRSHLLSQDPQDWGTFGDFVGGTANPILTFLTVAMLAITIILQARQLAVSSHELKLSREELELTRKELRRSASAQELSEQALRSQAAAAESTARLAAINTLMDHYAKEISRHGNANYPSSDPRLHEFQGLKRRHSVLQQRLEQFYVQLTGEDHGQ